MSGSINKVILIGNIGKDPEVFSMQNGGKVVNFTLATNETWRNKETSELEKKTEWHRIVVFNERLAGVAEQYLRKGAKVYVEGQLQTRKWTDNSGMERYTTEVVLSRFRGDIHMLDSKGESDGSRSDNVSPFPQSNNSAPSSTEGAGEYRAASGSDVSGGAAAGNVDNGSLKNNNAGPSADDNLDDDVPF